MINRLAIFLATGLGAGFLPQKLLSLSPKLRDKKWTGAGFIGSIEGALTFLFLPALWAQSWQLIVLAIIVAAVVGGRAEKVMNSHDDPRIIIDEWIGVWIAMWGFEQRLSIAVALAFLFFRVFDVMKGPVGRWLQKLPGGWGVVADDVYAGILANIVTRFITGLIHLIL